MSPEDDHPAIHGTEHDDLCAMIAPGDIYLFYAPKRAGKTTASLLLAYWASRFHNYRIVSNILLRRRDPAKFEGMGGWRRVLKTEGYEYVENYYQLMTVVEDFLRKRGPLERPNLENPQRLLFIMDEAATSRIRMGQTTLSPLVQAIIGQGVLIGHMGMAMIMLTQSQELISAKFRGIESGLVTGFLTKPPISGYSRQEVLQFELQDPDVPFKPNGKDVNLKRYPIYLGPLEGWARTPNMIRKEDGTYLDVPIFDTESAAAFDMGSWPQSAGARAGKPFDLQGLLSILATQLSEDFPDVMSAYLRGEIGAATRPEDEEVFVGEEDEESEEESDEPEDEGFKSPQPVRAKREPAAIPAPVDHEKVKADLIKWLLAHPELSDPLSSAKLSNEKAAIAFSEDTHHRDISREYVRQVRKELHDAGRF